MSSTSGQVDLVPMTPQDYESYVPYVLADYASRTSGAGVVSRADSEARAHREFTRLLPQGLDTPDNTLCVITVDGEERPVGRLWYALRGAGEQRYAMILNVEVDAEYRGQGYGRSVMRACAQSARAEGALSLRINLLGEDIHNKKLYESLGMTEMSVLMNWDIGKE
ncbi:MULTISPECIES: GNAT family N-acetyltransferase [unclassified Streptomyces]|uniref:GNAT family N-acetyltransferase n=1 Tax=unclassified Streptomyces TaxID=2593676 RepID=UPI002E0D7E09|nr:GNAT family N-acetyltransferase [Streptomyces sp. NBC_01197]WSS49019.1 GNAT family N-acetyltransferase [Streptomyces sp. NBC_01180]